MHIQEVIDNSFSDLKIWTNFGKIALIKQQWRIWFYFKCTVSADTYALCWGHSSAGLLSIMSLLNPLHTSVQSSLFGQDMLTLLFHCCFGLRHQTYRYMTDGFSLIRIVFYAFGFKPSFHSHEAKVWTVKLCSGWCYSHIFTCDQHINWKFLSATNKTMHIVASKANYWPHILN